ncbi:MAG: hypothetical protein E7679_06305 [Ruminococcaceae bacterium]|nr:hypothetical protein [Oscillospiraceae bacterium]
MNKYNELLKNQILTSVVVIVLIIVLAIILFTLNKRHFFDDLGKIGRTVVNLFVVTIILLAGIYFSVRILHLYRDIHEQAYITYHGNFEVSPFKEGYVTLREKSGHLKLDGKVDLPGGQYSGTIVYAQNSKYILAWNVE